ncbi:hypothetical protein M413DRAFT_440606 [Hebeloma cylindrosporum]|uniref:Uncharacterized protein n=1 Tax=Hebeloma cylindrosporum TaxID=76867 RepID=A0A0C3CT46_HEBCY|nr:hypothetical protein M413DRAFT_440606 [Hebeloma cylindrosporum h7]
MEQAYLVPSSSHSLGSQYSILHSALGIPNITLKVMDRDLFALSEVQSRLLHAFRGAA